MALSKPMMTCYHEEPTKFNGIFFNSYFYSGKCCKSYILCAVMFSLQWHHNERNGISNHQPHHCLLNHLFWCGSEKTSKLHVTGLCEGNSPVTGEFPTQMASYVENVSIWWYHHVGERCTKDIHAPYPLTWDTMVQIYFNIYIVLHQNYFKSNFQHDFYLPCNLYWSLTTKTIFVGPNITLWNHQPHHCLLNRLFRCRSKKTQKLRVTDLCEGNSPVTGEFPFTTGQ